jgi:hypothetical protein
VEDLFLEVNLYVIATHHKVEQISQSELDDYLEENGKSMGRQPTNRKPPTDRSVDRPHKAPTKTRAPYAVPAYKPEEQEDEVVVELSSKIFEETKK